MRETPDAMFNEEPVLSVRPELLAELKRRAEQSPRGRYRLCLHAGPEAAVQEMVIASRGDAFCRPHSHPASGTTVLMLEGEMDFIVFDDAGEVASKTRLAPPGGPRPCSVHLAAGRWHMDLVRSPVAVVYEVAAGPFVKGRSSVFPPWSPEENDPAAMAALLARVMSAPEC